MIKRKYLYFIIFYFVFNIFIIKAEDMIEIGANAPLFTLNDYMGNEYSLSSFKGKKFIVLIFYPGDETPTCTEQLCEIRDDYSLFEKKDAVVFGINTQAKDSHEKFSVKYKFQFPLLIDKDKTIVKAYKTKGFIMTTRTVYVIDKSGKIIYAQRGKPAVSDILKSIP